MKKLTLNELRNDGRVIYSRKQMLIMGGGDGTFYNPYTQEEADHLMDSGFFNGGYVINSSGETNWLGQVTINGYYGSGYNNPWNTDSIVSGIGTVTDYCDPIASALADNAGKTRVIGSAVCPGADTVIGGVVGGIIGGYAGSNCGDHIIELVCGK